MSAAKEKTTADWLEVKSELARVTAERDAAWERLDEFGSGGLVYGISAMRAALIDAVRRAEKAEKAEKANAALRAALEELVTPNRGMGFGGMDRRFAEENARAALADPNLGADWVPRAEMEEQQRQYAENLAGREQQYQAELRRVAEAVREVCANCIVKDGNPMVALERIQAVDLDAILRGGK